MLLSVWAIGTLQGMDDILPEIEVGFAGGTNAVIDSGALVLAGRAVGNISVLIARAKVRRNNFCALVDILLT